MGAEDWVKKWQREHFNYVNILLLLSYLVLNAKNTSPDSIKGKEKISNYRPTSLKNSNK